MINNPSSTEDAPETPLAYAVRELTDTPRANPEENEDASLVHRRADGGVTALILDGATGVGSVADPYKENMAKTLGLPNVSGGRFASLVMKREIERLINAGTELSPKVLLLRGAESLRTHLQAIGVADEHCTQIASTLGALVDLSPAGELRWASIRADVSALVVRKDGTWEWHPAEHPLDYHEGKALATALRNSPADISASLSKDAAVQTYINDVNRAGENATTYGSFNGAETTAIAPWIDEGTSRVESGDKVYLFTDGFLPEKPKRAYDNDDAFREEQRKQREAVVQNIREGGPEALLAAVRLQQRNDPTCTLHPRFKAVGDDATLIEIDV